MSLSSDIPVDENLLGKVVGDLQDDIEITGDKITGTLLWVDDYTGFSGDATEQSGNYLVTKCTAQEGDTITVRLTAGRVTRPITLGDDGILIARITDKDAQKLIYTATAADGSIETREFDLSGLTLESSGG